MKKQILVGIALVGIALGIATARADGEQMIDGSQRQKLQVILEAKLAALNIDENASFKDVQAAHLTMALGDKKLRLQMFNSLCPPNMFCIQAFSPIATMDLQITQIEQPRCGAIVYRATNVNPAIGGEVINVTVEDNTRFLGGRNPRCAYPMAVGSVIKRRSAIAVTVETSRPVIDRKTGKMEHTRSVFTAPSMSSHTEEMDYFQN